MWKRRVVVAVSVLLACCGDEAQSSRETPRTMPVSIDPTPADTAYPPVSMGVAENSVGTLPELVEPATCDPNYEPCVPIDSDVDCEGGQGNGPSYVRGPVRVVGRDKYRLDGDGDGVGCEN